MMFDPERLLGNLISGQLSGKGGKKKKKKDSGWTTGMKGKIGLGALGVAIAAYEHFKQSQQQQQNAPPGSGSASGPAAPPSRLAGFPPQPTTSSAGMPATPPPVPPPLPGQTAGTAGGSAASLSRPDSPASTEPFAVWLIRAMVAAAACDGRIDQDERNKILSETANNGLSRDEVEFLERELDSPRTVSEIAAAGSNPDERRQLYAASLLAIDVDTPAEQQYLQDLAARLQLTADDLATVHEQLDE